MDLVAIQMVSTPDIETNFQQLETQLIDFQHQRQSGTAMVVLPECFALFGGSAQLNIEHMEVLGEGRISQRLSQIAQHYDVWLFGGTIPIRSHVDDKFQATLPVFNPSGELVADYQKLHLFDVDVSDNTGQYRESDTTVPGTKVVLVEIQGITVGLAVCYDVRFPGLFNHLASLGADIVVLPSAFTCPTGQAHWQSLLRARSIENQVFMVAAGQGGKHANGRETYGNSMIVDPWGCIVAQLCEEGPGWISWGFDKAQLDSIRARMPVVKHNRFETRLA